MTEIILELAALLLALFCLIYISSRRRRLRSALPKGLSALKDRGTVYFAMLCANGASAAAAVAETAAKNLGAGEGVRHVLHAGHIAFEIVFFLVFALYAAILLRRRESGGGRKSDRWTALALFCVCCVGAVVQRVWAIRVALFFEAIAMFGCLTLIEQDADSAERGMSHRFQAGVTLAIGLMILAVILANATLILNLSNEQSNEIGNIQLDVIRGQLQETLTVAETNVLRVAHGVEQLLESGASRETLAEYFISQREKYLSDGSFMNTYIAGRDWHIVPGFDAPESFHASERIWYLGAVDRAGEVYISEPYLDADTGAMCFTVSVPLPDGETVVGMDLNFSKAQESIRQMTQGNDRSAMIVTEGGLIVGYTDMSLVGERADARLPEYADILRRVAASQEHGSFQVTLNGRPCMIFSSETSNNWFLILAADTGALYAESYRQMAMLVSINLLMLAVVLVYFALSLRKARRAEKALAENKGSIERFSGWLRESASHLMRLGDIRLFREEDDPVELVEQVKDAGQRLSDLSRELSSYSAALGEQGNVPREKAAAGSLEAPSRRVRNGIIVSLLVSLVIVMAFCVRISTNEGTARLNREADSYENQLNEWLTQQQSILYLFTDMISVQPELVSDYGSAVRWLNSVAKRYPDISLCYMANPYAEHPVIMSNGWEPGEDFRPETRPWYRATERAANGFSISAPYLDAQSGNYCVTLSRVVYGEKDEFLGIFGIDFFLDKLINVLGESYTSLGYAFLVDSEGIIINHPNSGYQMGGDVGTSVEDTEYAEAYNRSSVSVLRDYAAQLMACISRKTASGFTVMVANRWWNMYGGVVIVAVIFVSLFSVCLAYIVILINRLIRWQEDVNRRLTEAATAAENANRAKSQFLSQMSHEIRTPMNAIIGLDSIALRNEEISPRTRDELEKIGFSARHLLSLINDILDMSRIESGRMTLKNERFSFREILSQVRIIINGQCEDKGLRFVCNLAEPLDEYFTGDDLKLKQVLINILGNSVKFTDPPGVITFTVEQADGPDDDTALLRFTMEDTGIGMDKDFIPKLFEAFSQEDAGSTNRYGGSGLGMAITKSIVEMMGGEIKVESEKGLGSTFIVSVALGRVREQERPQTPSDEARAESVSVDGLHLLIAEDQAMNAEILADLLEMEGMTSEWVENGQRTVELFEQHEQGHFDAILMDMRMPVMDGLAATQAIRRLPRPDAASIPIIALTANAFEKDVKLCLQAGMNAHLSKPVDMELLKATLGKLLTR